MALSLDSKIRDIMRSPEGKLVMEKYIKIVPELSLRHDLQLFVFCLYPNY